MNKYVYWTFAAALGITLGLGLFACSKNKGHIVCLTPFGAAESDDFNRIGSIYRLKPTPVVEIDVDSSNCTVIRSLEKAGE